MKKTAVRVRGTVMSFDRGKGYGFVVQGGGDELFADQKAVQSDDLYILAIGDQVRYEVIDGPHGRCVASVRAI
jgi:cold shock CspA family protein